jgi:hypothetical protein
VRGLEQRLRDRGLRELRQAVGIGSD